MTRVGPSQIQMNIFQLLNYTETFTKSMYVGQFQMLENDPEFVDIVKRFRKELMVYAVTVSNRQTHPENGSN